MRPAEVGRPRAAAIIVLSPLAPDQNAEGVTILRPIRRPGPGLGQTTP
jgi:hypothetical protein